MSGGMTKKRELLDPRPPSGPRSILYRRKKPFKIGSYLERDENYRLAWTVGCFNAQTRSQLTGDSVGIPNAAAHDSGDSPKVRAKYETATFVSANDDDDGTLGVPGHLRSKRRCDLGCHFF